MDATNNTVQRCTQCDNNCPIDALKCGKGRRFFGLEDREHGSFDPDSLTGLLKKCGHALHHSGGALNEAELFQDLSEEECSSLKALLQKLTASWDKRLGAGGAHDHGERGRRSHH